ncbi:hypothetical protein GCM10020295_53340 [Streptomyces cinereospinus]
MAGREVAVGRLFEELPEELARARDKAESNGRTAVVAGWDGVARGVLAVADAVQETSAQAVRELRALGLTPVLLTGDNRRVAEAVARTVGIDQVIAEVLPEDKVAVVRRLQGEGRTVAMVGDGVNDAAALATADLGLAMGTGTDAAIEAGDLTLVRGDLRVAADAIRLSRRTLATIKGNLVWAFGYNVAALPLAAAGLLNPMIAGGGDGPVVGVRRDEQSAAAGVPLSSAGQRKSPVSPSVRREPHISSSQGSRIILTLEPRSSYRASCVPSRTYAGDSDHSDVNVTIEGVRRSKLAMSEGVLGAPTGIWGRLGGTSSEMRCRDTYTGKL